MEQRQNKVTVRQIQEVQLEILKAIIQICKNHDIHYVAFGGTCLGAVRHKGFIPWDDDIDILMSREDYERFNKIANSELPQYIRLHTPEDLSWPGIYIAKVFNENTTCIEKARFQLGLYNEGIFVDLMVLDGVPENRLERKVILCANIFLYNLSYFLSYKLEHVKRTSSKIFWILASPIKPLLSLFIKDRYLIPLHERLYRKYKLKECSTVSFNWSVRGSKRYFPASLFLETVELPFEDTFITCPKDFDTYLRSHYGDYMQLPSEEEQNNGHNFCVVDLNHPYKDYDPKTGDFKKC